MSSKYTEGQVLWPTECAEGLVDGLRLLQALPSGQGLGQSLTASQVDQVEHACSHTCIRPSSSELCFSALLLMLVLEEAR